MNLLLFLQLILLFSVVAEAGLSCSAGKSSCLDSFLNSSSVLSTFLGDHGTVVFQNDILKGNKSACAGMNVIFARGTDEPGNVGILTGPPFFAAMAEYLNGTNLAIQGVDYPADTAGFFAGGSAIGTIVMAALINKTVAACPNTPLLVSGYSQGAQLVHDATASLPANTTAKISSVVLFGDPKNGTALTGVDANKVLTICNTSDDICKGGDIISLAHLSYSKNATMAAMFVMGSAGAKLGITSQKMRPAGGGIGL